MLLTNLLERRLTQIEEYTDQWYKLDQNQQKLETMLDRLKNLVEEENDDQ